MNNSISNRVAIYARVSTQEQAEQGYSIDAQVKILYEYCKQTNKIPFKEYIDAGISGKAVETRPQLQQLLLDAQAGLFDEVIVWKINRLSRNQLDLMNLVDTLNKHNVIFRSYSENFETETPMGRFALQMMGSVAELERNTIVDNVKMGMKQRAKEGNWNGGIILGYKSVSENKNKTSKLEIIPEEALIVQHIFNLYANGKGLRAITNQLNHEGYKTKKNNSFNVVGVKEILLNPLYIGKIRFGRNPNYTSLGRSNSTDFILSDGKHKPIINLDLWEKVQTLYNLKSHKPPKTFDGSYPLTGLIKCPICGASMVAHRTKKQLKDGTYKIHRYYACGQWRNKGSAICNSNSIHADYAENYIFHRLKEILRNSKILNDIVDNINIKKKSLIKPLTDELKLIDKTLKEIDKKNDKYFNLYEDDIIDKNTLSQKLQDLKNQKETSLIRKTNIQLQLNNESTTLISYDYVKDVLKNFDTLLESSDSETQKTLLQLIIKDIIINKEDRKIEKVTLKFDENTQKHFIQTKLKESSSDEDSSFSTKHIKKSYPLFVVRFTLHYPKPFLHLYSVQLTKLVNRNPFPSHPKCQSH